MNYKLMLLLVSFVCADSICMNSKEIARRKRERREESEKRQREKNSRKCAYKEESVLIQDSELSKEVQKTAAVLLELEKRKSEEAIKGGVSLQDCK